LTEQVLLLTADSRSPDLRRRRVDSADQRAWVHWVLYNLGPEVSMLEQAGRHSPSGSLDGLNDWKRAGYGGPCPPIGRHRYFFKLYAPDAMLADLKQPTRQEPEKAMEQQLLAKAELIGTYHKA
jgi:hypothetical protein